MVSVEEEAAAMFMGHVPYIMEARPGVASAIRCQ